MVVDFLVECDWEAEEEVALDEWVVGRGRRPDIVWRCCWGCEGIQTGKAGVWRGGYWHDGGCGVGAVPAVDEEVAGSQSVSQSMACLLPTYDADGHWFVLG